jgi:hypothetical protein
MLDIGLEWMGGMMAMCHRRRFEEGGGEGVEQCEAAEWVTFFSRNIAISERENGRRPKPGGSRIRSMVGVTARTRIRPKRLTRRSC